MVIIKALLCEKPEKIATACVMAYVNTVQSVSQWPPALFVNNKYDIRT